MSSTNSLILSLLSLLSSRSRAPGARDERRPAGRMARRAATGGEDGTTAATGGLHDRSEVGAPLRARQPTPLPPWTPFKARAAPPPSPHDSGLKTRRHRSARRGATFLGCHRRPSAGATLCRTAAFLGSPLPGSAVPLYRSKAASLSAMPPPSLLG